MRHNAENLRAELAAAFFRREYPGGDRIAHGIEGMPSYEGNRAWEWLRGKTWQDVLAEGIAADYHKLPRVLMCEAWLYYFPALATLASEPDAVELAKALLHHLSHLAEEIAYRVSPRERRAIVNWLEAIADTWEQSTDKNLARKVLDGHWARFEGEELATDDAETSKMERDVERLRAELAASFSGREPPGVDDIASPSTCSEEALEARDWLRGKTWQDVLVQGMGLEHRDLLSFITPEAWLYYFPAFATLGLDTDHPAELSETLPLTLAWSPDNVKSLAKPEERRAIAHVLAYWAEAWDRCPAGTNVPRYALETHWSETLADQAAGKDRAAPRHAGKALQAEIQAAFAEREYPRDDRFSDTAQSGESAAEVERWLRGKTWQELLGEGERVWQGHLIICLSPEAWLYYFPAFATLALEPEHPARLQDILLQKLTWFPQDLEPFLEPAERQAIVHFLEFWADAYSHGRYDSDLPRFALTTHWAKDRHHEPTTSDRQENGHAIS